MAYQYNENSYDDGGGNHPDLFSSIGNFLGAYMLSKQDYKNPADKAMPYLDQVPGMVSPYYDPYIQSGRRALSTTENEYGNLIRDPGARMNQIGQSFHQSPGYQYQVDQALGAANRASAAGGMLGSPMEMQGIAQSVNGMANQDYYNYLDRALNLYGQGLNGMSDINHLGYGAADKYASDLYENQQNKANLAYAGQADENNFEGRRRGRMASMIGNGISGVASSASRFLPFKF